MTHRHRVEQEAAARKAAERTYRITECVYDSAAIAILVAVIAAGFWFTSADRHDGRCGRDTMPIVAEDGTTRFPEPPPECR